MYESSIDEYSKTLEQIQPFRFLPGEMDKEGNRISPKPSMEEVSVDDYVEPFKNGLIGWNPANLVPESDSS